ncbi:hypothetical protein P5673_012287 [Acropora cervicornis]|uniref:Uncharacterized protein n=1 Tax=Acropora cervicornis TaxID=6130 RepID=A0AAD9QN84_ACRCE|nr:hypothetical protein P5673_012287 [Acropora cervicornis]
MPQVKQDASINDIEDSKQKSVLSKSAMITSFPKLNSPVFDDDACAWPNCYGLFKALIPAVQDENTLSLRLFVDNTEDF